MGRIVGIEPTHVGTTIQCVNHFTNSASTHVIILLNMGFVNNYLINMMIAMTIKMIPPATFEYAPIRLPMMSPKIKPR